MEVNITDMVKELQFKRECLAKEKLMNKEAMEAFLTKRAANIASEAQLKSEVTQLESAIKTAAAEAYQADNSIGKKPYPGVNIACGKKITYAYTEQAAYDWALSKNMCLKLDTAAFEAICATNSKPGFVHVDTQDTITAKLDTDLSKALSNA